MHASQETNEDELARLRDRVTELEASCAEFEQSQAALAARYRMLESVMQGTTDAVFIKDLEGRYLMINQAGASFLGKPVHEIIGHDDTDLFSPDTARVIMDSDRQVIASGQTRTYEEQGTSSGKTRTYLATKGPYRDAEGRIIGLIGISRDITERKRAELTLRESENKFRKLTETLDAAIFIYQSSRLLYVNPAATQITGYTTEELLSMDFWEVVHPDQQPLAKERGAARLRGDVVASRYEVCIAHKTKGRRWVEFHAGEIEFEGQPAILGTAFDISARKKAEESLRESERRFRSLATSSPVGIFQTDMAGEFLFVNDRWSEISGITASDALGQGWLRAVHEEDRPAITEAWKSCLERKSQFAREFRMRRPDGRTRWVVVRAEPLAEESATDAGYIGTMTDVTDRRQAEEKLRADQHLLRRLLDLQEQERKLIAYEIHDGFLQDVIGTKMQLERLSHEVRESTPPLANTLDELQGRLGKAIKEGRRMISDLRPLIIDEQGIVEAIRYLVAEYEARGSLHVEFTHHVAFNRLPSLLEGTLYRIAQEALQNVLRHSGTKYARVRLQQLDAGLTLEIQDHGSGFDPEKVRPDSFGVRSIIERARLFGGTATVESVPGGGTRVLVQMPLHQVETKN